MVVMKRSILILSLASMLAATISCTAQKTDRSAQTEAQKKDPVEVPMEGGLAHAYFASGCFWCMEAVYESVKGVKEAHSGYSGGHKENPTYEDSNTGKSGHAESVEVIYDPKVVKFETLLDVYFGSQDVTQANGQGPDHGSQYRSIIFYQNAEQKKAIDEKIAALNKKIAPKEAAAEVLPFQKFWMAEDYHQDYEKNHPENSYVQGVSTPRLRKFQDKFPELLKAGVKH